MPIRRVLPPAKAALFNQFGRGIVHMGLFDSLPEPEGDGNMLLTVSSFSPEMLGGGQGVVSAVPMDSNTVEVANRIWLFPLILVRSQVVKSLFVVNGTAVAGSIQFGFYSPEGWLMFASPAVAQSGTLAMQVVNIAAEVLDPGSYYFALGFSSASATFLCKTAAAAAELAGIGMLLQDGVSSLPQKIFPTANVSTRLPLCGFRGLTLL